MLDKGVPMDWIVSLMDNPGFGDIEECITHLADASMVFSSAYIYLMQLENVKGKEAAKFFEELNKIDRGTVWNLASSPDPLRGRRESLVYTIHTCINVFVH